MRFGRKTKACILSALSLLVVGTAAVSTAAWFVLEAQPLTNELVTSTPNLSVQNDDIYSYKVSHEIDPGTGFIDYSSTSIQKTKGNSFSVDNGHQAGEDANFNVPSDGIGYYLVKKNTGGTYTFTYFGTSYAWKLQKLNGVNRYYCSEVQLSANDKVAIKHYDFSNHKTVITSGAIDTCSYGGTVDQNIVTVTATGTYKAWLTHNNNTWDLSLEPAEYDVGSLNRSAKAKPDPKRAVTKGTKRFNIFIETSCFWKDANAAIYATYNGNGQHRIYKDNDLTAGTGDQTSYNYLTIGGTQYYVLTETVTAVNDSVFSYDNFYFERKDPSSGTSWNNSGWIGSPKNDFATGSNNTMKFSGTTADNDSFTPWGNYYKVCYNAGLNFATTTYGMVYADDFAPDDPATISGYTFKGWYTDSNLSTPYTTQTLTGDINLYAKYEKTNGYSASTYNVKLFLNGNTDWGTTVYCYAYGGSGTYSTYTNAFIPENHVYSVSRSSGSYTDGNTGSTTSYYYYNFNISTSFPHIIFTKYDHFTAYACDQTVDLENASSKGNKYFVITGGGGDNKWTGSWYGSISGVSSTKYDYYIFDKEEYLSENSGTPKVYAWKNNQTGGPTNTYPTFYLPNNTANASENAAWPGAALLTTDGNGDALPAHVYRFRISSTFDSFILNNGKARGAAGSFQTQDLTSLSGHNTSTGSLDTNTWFYTFSGKTQKGDYYEVAGSWTQGISIVNLRVSLCVYDGVEYRPLTTLNGSTSDSIAITNGYIELANDLYATGSPYTPSVTSVHGGAGYIVDDSAHGVLYYFNVPDSLSWYKNQACTEAFDPVEDADYTGALYVRAYADMSAIKTFYVDASAWGAASLTIKTTDASTTWMTLGSGSTVAPNLFKMTMPGDTWNFQINYNSYAVDGAVTMETEDTSNFLSLDDASIASAHTWRKLEEKSIGEAVIYAYENSSWVEKATMSIGDIEHYGSSAFSNYFIYEHGLRLPKNTKFKVVYTAGDDYEDYPGYSGGEYDPKAAALVSKTFSQSNTTDYTGDRPAFLSQSGDLATANNVFEGTARFNFYITNELKLSVAMVPDYGNGFYIMKYNSSYGMDNFINGTKMNAPSTQAAIYTGYYISQTTQLFVRSYIDGVDTLCNDWDPTSIANASMNGDGLITITGSGYFNISVTSATRVKITAYTGIAEAFKLNPLDTSNVATRSAIKGQKTTLFMEVPFYCNNPYTSTIKLSVSNPFYQFIGAGLYVTNTKLNETNIYATLTANAIYNNLTKFTNGNATQIANLNTSFTSVPANQGGLFYAYIIVDYLPTEVSGVSYADFNTSALLESRMGYQLIGVQN